MAKLGTFTVNIGEQVRVCNKNSCGYVYSNHLSSCPKCGGTDYIAKALTKEMERDIERQQ